MKRKDIGKFAIPSLALIMLGVSSCNEKSDPEEEAYGDVTSVAVTAFKLKADVNLLNRLDSVFFSIDLENGVIFNADSLPKGTDVTGLIPVITYPKNVSAAVIKMSGGTKRQGEINYLKNPSDSVDFTGDVTLTLTAEDGIVERSYRLKVNVHKQLSDTLTWDNLASAGLPSRHSKPVSQKSVLRNEKAWTLIQERDNSYTLASTPSPANVSWQKEEVIVPQDAMVRTFTATDDTFYLLDGTGNLYSSVDGKTWTLTGEQWTSILGGYGTSVLGISTVSGERQFVSYPAVFNPMSVPEDFPVNSQSNIGLLNTKWSSSPIALLAGGRNENGEALAAVWGFDGYNWARISQDGTPVIADATLVPYTYYRPNTGFGTTEYSVWLLLGGYKDNGELNRTVYMSYDNGVTWQAAVDYMQLPDVIPSFANADCLVLTEEREASLKDYWSKQASRKPAPWFVKYEQDGYDLTWEVPYMYLFGGFTADGHLHNTIWRGVLNRLTFTPLI